VLLPEEAVELFDPPRTTRMGLDQVVREAQMEDADAISVRTSERPNVRTSEPEAPPPSTPTTPMPVRASPPTPPGPDRIIRDPPCDDAMAPGSILTPTTIRAWCQGSAACRPRPDRGGGSARLVLEHKPVALMLQAQGELSSDEGATNIGKRDATLQATPPLCQQQVRHSRARIY
jgi:hypothetical protein